LFPNEGGLLNLLASVVLGIAISLGVLYLRDRMLAMPVLRGLTGAYFPG
jgi:hypothetical protein